MERTLQLHKALTELGVGSQLLTVTDPKDANQNSLPDQITYLPCMNSRWFIPFPLILRVRKAVEQTNVIHLMNHWTLLNVLVYFQTRKQKKPYIVCPAGAMTVYGRSKIKKYFYQLIIGKSILRNASAAIAISPDEVQQLEDNGVSPQTIFQIPNGVNVADFDFTDVSLFRD